MGVEVDRRLFLQFLGAGLTGAAWHGTPLGPLTQPALHAAAQTPLPPRSPFADFTRIDPSMRDDLVLPDGFTHDVIALWGDRLPGTNTRFGYNADYTAFFPTAPDGSEGVLVVNHEHLSMPEPGEVGVYLQTFPVLMGRVAEIYDEMHDVGMSVLQVRRDADQRWRIVPSPLTRRYDATSPMRVSGPALQRGERVAGTLANCSGCHTPWNTVLTCEENIHFFVPPEADTGGRSRTGGRFRLDGSHYGWVVEIDPMDPGWVPVKHTSLGRFRHENVAIRAEAGRPIAAYMGDDRINGHVYKFVSERSYSPAADHRGSLLASGRLYAAFFRADGTGEWHELSGTSPLRPNQGSDTPPVPKGATTLGQVYKDAGAIVTDAYRAANLIGATPTGRPEDIEVHPLDGSVYIAFTERATARGSLFTNLHGEICRIRDEDDDVTGARFTWMRWKAGGPNNLARRGHVFAAPDNLSFDPNGDLWVVCDVTTVRLNGDPRYTAFQNNGMFFVPASGPEAGLPRQFASGPCESELTGPSWTPDRETLFLSVQHPGEGSGMRTGGMPAPRGSNWPGGRPTDPPRPGVVSIRRG